MLTHQHGEKKAQARARACAGREKFITHALITTACTAQACLAKLDRRKPTSADNDATGQQFVSHAQEDRVTCCCKTLTSSSSRMHIACDASNAAYVRKQTIYQTSNIDRWTKRPAPSPTERLGVHISSFEHVRLHMQRARVNAPMHACTHARTHARTHRRTVV